MKTPKIVATMMLAALVAVGSASAFDASSFPEPIEKGSIIITPMFGFGFYDPLLAPITKDSVMLGGGLAVDYALPFAALTVGLESGFYGAKIEKGSWGTDLDSTVGIVPIIARIGWHPNFEIKGLDVYLVAKIGYALGFWGGKFADSYESPSGLAYGGDIGVRYFFTDVIGVVLEGGYDYYVLTYKVKSGSGSWAGWATKYVSAGVSFKL